ncbi:TIGR01777 family protein [Mucilaginibacter pallidiroseus]|uniref:TIGR01777 family protein n=1 Tax=Mucilaginibacter pallidiroseus TaxID=2599295 RepID=A0A563UG26_9SPHI|nr:TIGR01777 family oxidoreductase [Mucilaginibacter pallidiroseus]TWR30287.1 TIGR01777 family protein [Mucilaginibacter pallidiroseus]
MLYKKIILAGGNGYLGGVLANYYKDKAGQVIILSRKPKIAEGNISTIVWDGKTAGAWVDELEGADLLINLCGKNVNCRYTKANRGELFSSRLVPTRLLGNVVAGLRQPPALWINITSATIYRHAEDRPQDEDTGEIGYGMSIDICKQWEQTLFDTITPNTRKVALRMGIVLGRSGGAFPRLLNLVRVGMGGRQGDGRQYISWVHEQDAAKCTEWLLQSTAVDGVVNCTAPEAVTNSNFMQLLRDAYGVPFGFPTPVWLMEIGARIIGTETELVFKSRWVKPGKLINGGYQFIFSKAKHAVHDLLAIHI